ncbi:MAG: ATPase, T2SS/T4P/T4SS family [Nitrososphaerota archaeon]
MQRTKYAKREEVPDVIVDELSLITGAAAEFVESGGVSGRILIHRRIMRDIRERLRRGDDVAVRELARLRRICAERGIPVELIGDESAGDQFEALAELALRTGASVLTADPFAQKVCEALGADVIRVRIRGEWELDRIFTGNVMSLHLKEGVRPRVKVGTPGKWSFVEISEEPVRRESLELFVLDLLQRVHDDLSRTSFIEVQRENTLILQYGEYRVVVTRPPLSDGLEVTVVRPIVRKRLEEYELPDVLRERLVSRAEGILIAGGPGMGKSTFAQALAEHYRSLGKVVKTIESPRDLMLSDEITQYSKSASGEGELHDVLLLSRPDYTVFDEMRDDEDFQLFIDLRLAGIGMVGVVHATSPIDAIQRIANRVDIGVVPSIVDTVIFMKAGEVAKVYVLEVSVRVPRGMKRADLARPTIQVRNLFTGEVEYEMYVFGERTFIVPVGGEEHEDHGDSRVRALLDRVIGRYIEGYDLRVSGGTVRLEIPPEQMRVYVKKLQRRVHKICQQFDLELEVSPKR